MIPNCLPDIAPESRGPVPGPTAPAGCAGSACFITEIGEALSRAVAAMLTCQEASDAPSSPVASNLAGFFVAGGEVASGSTLPANLPVETAQGERKAKHSGEGESEENQETTLASAEVPFFVALPPAIPPEAALAVPGAPLRAQDPPASGSTALTPVVPGQAASPMAGGAGAPGREADQAVHGVADPASLQPAIPAAGQSAGETLRPEVSAPAAIAGVSAGAQDGLVDSRSPVGTEGAPATVEREGSPLSGAAGRSDEMAGVVLGPRPAPPAAVPPQAAEPVTVSTLEADGLPRATRANGEAVVPRFVSGPRESEFVATLEPKDLGQLGVRVVLREGALRVSFAAERPEATQLIQTHLPELRQSLEEQGLRLTGLGLERDGLAWSLLGDGSQQRYREGQFGSSLPVKPGDDAGEALALSGPGTRATDGARGLDVLV